MDINLLELDGGNREAALALRVAPEQERFVGGPVIDALAEAAEYPHANPWHRLAYAGDVQVGFVMISWNVEPRPPDIIAPWWRLPGQDRGQPRPVAALLPSSVRGAPSALASTRWTCGR